MDIKSVKPRGPTPPSLDQQLQKAAKMYEQQFLQEMMQAMRKTVVETNESSMAEKIYKDQLNDQYVEQWAENGGNGLADMIYKELKEKIIPSQYSRYVAGSGPQGANQKSAKAAPIEDSLPSTNSPVPESDTKK